MYIRNLEEQSCLKIHFWHWNPETCTPLRLKLWEIARWIHNTFILTILFYLLLQQVQQQAIFRIHMYFFLIWGIGKCLIMVVHSGCLLESLLLDLLMWDAVSLPCVIFRGTPVSGSNSLIQWRKMWQTAVDSIYIKMARWAKTQCRLLLWKQLDFLRARTKQSRRQTENWSRMGESDRNS